MITVDSPIVGKGGTFAEAADYTYFPGGDKDEDAYTQGLFRLCHLVGLDFRILFAQAMHETADFSSSWWKERRNPAGIGITGDPAQDAASPTFANGTDAARAHVVHMLVYVYGGTMEWPDSVYDAVGDYQTLDPRFLPVMQAGYAGTVHKLGDLGNDVWAEDPKYAPKIAAKANLIFAGGASMQVYPVVGLPGPGIPLPVVLSHDIIDASQTNQRPGIPLSKPYNWVVHETANLAPGADAAMHNQWLHNGADGQQLSFHFCADDHSIYQMIPIDEVTWQAADGAGPGNMNGISVECCVNAGGDEAKTRHNAEALVAGICKALGIPITMVKAHYDFNQADPDRHHCPDHMLSSGYWPTTFKANVAKIMSGGSTVPEPFPITWNRGDVGVQKIGDSMALALLGEVKAKRTVTLHQGAASDSPKVGEVKIGANATIVGTFRAKAGRRWCFVEYAPGKYGRALMSAFTPQYPTL